MDKVCAHRQELICTRASFFTAHYLRCKPLQAPHDIKPIITSRTERLGDAGAWSPQRSKRRARSVVLPAAVQPRLLQLHVFLKALSACAG